MKEKEVKPLPCPWGCKKTTVTTWLGEHRVDCTKLEHVARAYGDTRADAIRRWNRRAPVKPKSRPR